MVAKKKIMIYAYIAMLSIAVFASLSAATYAWFSGNRTVSTNIVKAKTGVEKIELFVSEYGDTQFVEKTVCDIVQVNKSDAQFLLPVSTADLKTFLFNSHTVDGMASVFEPVENEEHIYHGRIYLKASAKEVTAQKNKFYLYFDETEETTGLLATAEDEKILRAARLGLVLKNSTDDQTKIFKFFEEDDPDNQIYNTVIDGVTLGSDEVLTVSDNRVVATKDPSDLYKNYVATFLSDQTKLPEEPLFIMDLNEIYQLDIYFYLEGCDPDCSDEIKLDLCDLHLGFYGILGE